MSICRACDDLNCLRCESFAQCTECEQGFFLTNDATCEPCYETCYRCSSQLFCTECKTPTTLSVSDGYCSASCKSHWYIVDMWDAAYVTFFDNICQTPQSTFNKCFECNAECVDCAQYSNNCISCAVGEFLSNFEDSPSGKTLTTCVASCGSPKYIDDAGICQDCSIYGETGADCTVCTTAEKCTICSANLYGGNCFASCPDGSY